MNEKMSYPSFYSLHGSVYNSTSFYSSRRREDRFTSPANFKRSQTHHLSSKCKKPEHKVLNGFDFARIFYTFFLVLEKIATLISSTLTGGGARYNRIMNPYFLIERAANHFFIHTLISYSTHNRTLFILLQLVIM